MVRPFYRDPRVILACRVFVGLFFMVAASDKIASPQDFAVQIKNYRMLPHLAINIFALTLPWVEFAAGLFMVVGLWPRSAALLVCLMLLMFITALVQAIARDLNIDCGCFSGASKDLKMRVVEDLILFWMSWHVIVRGPGYRLAKNSSATEGEEET